MTTGQKTNVNHIYYWAVHVGLLTPLTFAWHHLSPLAAFTSGVYCLHNKTLKLKGSNIDTVTLTVNLLILHCKL